MRFLLSIYGNDDVWASVPKEEWPRIIAETDAHNKELAEAGELLFAGGVADQALAERVRRGDDGATVVTDGPHIETKEYLGSFYIVDCDSIERAREIAAAMPSATFTTIEIRSILHGGTAEDL